MKSAEAVVKMNEVATQAPAPIEAKAVQTLVKKLTQINTIKDKGGLDTASIMDICDHLQVEYNRQNPPSEVTVIRKTETNDYSSNIFVPQKGEEVTVIKINSDPTIIDMITMVGLIKELSQNKITNPQDIEQTKQWADKVNNYSLNLRQSALAMVRVQELALQNNPHDLSDFDKFYNSAAQVIYNLGESINLKRPNDTPINNLQEAYRDLVREQGTDKLDSYLSHGMSFGRYGKDRQKIIDPDPQVAFTRMAKLYDRASVKQKSSIIENIIENIVTDNVPKLVGNIKETHQDGQKKVDTIPRALVTETVLRGVEETYRKLPIPEAIKQLLDTPSVYDLSRVELAKIVDALDSQIGLDRIATIAFQLVGYNAKDLSFIDKFGNIQKQSLTQAFMNPANETLIRRMLANWQIQLDTLGLSKTNIESFSQWFEDPGFFDQYKLIPTVDHSLSVFRNVIQDKSISEANNILGQKLQSGEITTDQMANFQKDVIFIVIDQMRLIYGGWEEEVFGALQDSSPSRIVDRMKLNCAGRANMMLAVGQKLGLTEFGAIGFGHVAVVYEFANGERSLVDPVERKGHEFTPILDTVDDTTHLLHPGEAVWQDRVSKARYLIVEPNKAITSNVLINYSTYTADEKLINFSIEITSDATSLFNYFFSKNNLPLSKVSISDFAKLKGVSVEETKKLVERLYLLLPDPSIYQELGSYKDSILKLYQEAGIIT